MAPVLDLWDWFGIAFMVLAACVVGAFVADFAGQTYQNASENLNYIPTIIGP